MDGVHLAILGSGGIGKTSIALSVLHDSRVRVKFKEEDCHFNTCEALTSGAHIGTLILALAVKASTSTQSRCIDTLFLHLKQSYTVHPLLLVLDNFEKLWDIHRVIPKGGGAFSSVSVSFQTGDSSCHNARF